MMYIYRAFKQINGRLGFEYSDLDSRQGWMALSTITIKIKRLVDRSYDTVDWCIKEKHYSRQRLGLLSTIMTTIWHLSRYDRIRKNRHSRPILVSLSTIQRKIFKLSQQGYDLPMTKMCPFIYKYWPRYILSTMMLIAFLIDRFDTWPYCEQSREI